MAGGLADGLFSAFLNWMYQTGEISVPSDFHERCTKINYMLQNDVSGLINTILDYAVDSASETQFTIECSNKTLEKLLNQWLSMINLDLKLNGIPIGLQELAKEYYKERWQGSSLCLLRLTNWKKIEADNVSINVPTTMWFVNGSSVYVDRNEKNYKLGADKYYLDEDKKQPVPAKANEQIVVQKPFGRWFEQYPTPYLIRKGVYKNWKGIEVLQEKSDEVISKILPYLFVIEAGTEKLLQESDMNYDDPTLQKFFDNFKDKLEEYKSQKGKTPINVKTFDKKYEHLIPDLRNILTEELYRQGFRSMLSGLGFIDVIQGVSSTRKESVLNPKPFLSEVNAGVAGFKMILLQVINHIDAENTTEHRKLFSANSSIQIVNSPLRINTMEIMDSIRSGYDRGVVSIQSYAEVLGFDFTIEKGRREKEAAEGLEYTFYPHLIQNQEATPDNMAPVAPRKNKQDITEPQGKKKGTPEAKNYKAEEIVIDDLPEETELDMATVQGYAPEITENYIRLRQSNPTDFEKDSFRTIVLSKTQGIKAVVGRKKGQKTTSIQSYLFDKSKWSVKQVQEWVKKHRASIEEVVISELPENTEIAPYDLRNAPKSIKKLPKDLQELWVRVWNETYERYHDEAKAHKIAWTVVNKERNKQKRASFDSDKLKQKQEELVDKQLGLIKQLEENKDEAL